MVAVFAVIFLSLGRGKQVNQKDKGANPYILRERLRAWEEQLEHLDIWLQFPEWGELEDWLDSGALQDWLYCDEAEWCLYGDTVDVESCTYGIGHAVLASGSAQDVVRRILKGSPDLRELFLVSRDCGALYVIRSPVVESCSNQVEPPLGSEHPFFDLGNALSPGDTPTYVLPPDIVEEIVQMEIRNEEIERQYQEKRKDNA